VRASDRGRAPRDVGIQPREKPRQFLERFWASRTVHSALTRWLASWGAATALVVVVLFVVIAGRTGDAGAAFDVLTGARSPFTVGVPWAAVPLAALGYLLLPALVGAVVGVTVERRLESLTRTQEDAMAEMAERLREVTRPHTD
jgi:Family of unknown function (DUF6313)